MIGLQNSGGLAGFCSRTHTPSSVEGLSSCSSGFGVERLSAPDHRIYVCVLCFF
jgi:hypothetical protein